MDRGKDVVSCKQLDKFWWPLPAQIILKPICFRTDIEPDNPQCEQYVTNLIGSLIQELETKAATLNTEDLFLTKLKLIEAAKNFRVEYLAYFMKTLLSSLLVFFHNLLFILLHLKIEKLQQISVLKLNFLYDDCCSHRANIYLPYLCVPCLIY